MASSPRHSPLLLRALLLLLLLALCTAAKERPMIPTTQPSHAEVGEAASFVVPDERCGAAGDGKEEEEEECLMSRALVAHTDYIYTQGDHN